MGTLTVIWWRDIPAQVVATDSGQSHKVVLDARFQDAIDRAAVKAGRQQEDDYLADWRSVRRRCGDDLEAEAKREAASLEATYSKDTLRRLVASGGIDEARAETGV